MTHRPRTETAPPSACGCVIRDYQHPAHPAGYQFHWSFGNRKLCLDATMGFGLPAFRSADGFRTCPQASVCAHICYARQGRYLTQQVSRPREHNLAYLRSQPMDTFIAAAVQDLQQLHPAWRRVRIHDSGDFFNAAYFLAWRDIARAVPDLVFYGYTKMIRLLHTHRADLPPNLRLVQSYGGREDRLIDRALPHAFIFSSAMAIKLSGYVDGTYSDEPAYSGVTKIGLAYHGQRRLDATVAQRLTRAVR